MVAVVSLAGDIVAAIRADPDALEQLREILGVRDDTQAPDGRAAAFTVRSLAAEIGRSERSIRGAIARGELRAVRRGKGYVIAADAVDAWATGVASAGAATRPRPRGSRRRSGPGPMRRALNT